MGDRSVAIVGAKLEVPAWNVCTDNHISGVGIRTTSGCSIARYVTIRRTGAASRIDLWLNAGR